jgi:hypothetical protein
VRGQRAPAAVRPAKKPTPTGTLSFRIDFSQFACSFELRPAEIDVLWREFDPSLSWSAVIGQLMQISQPNFFASFFDGEPEPLFSEIRRFLRHFPLVIDPEGFITFASLPILDPIELIKMMPPKNGVLLHSSIFMISHLIKNLDDFELQQTFVLEFAQLLTPKAILNPPVIHESVKYKLFLPIINFEKRLFWFVLSRDDSALIIPFDGLSETVSATGDQIRLKDDIITAHGNIFRFTSPQARMIFVNSQQEPDPLLSFMNCLKEVAAHPKSLPKEFVQQLVEAIGSPDLDLASAVCQAIPHTNRPAMWPVIAALTHSEAITIFLRKAFAIDIAKIPDHNRLYRDNSVGMAATGLILRAHGQDVVDDLLELFTTHPNLPAREMLIKWIPRVAEASQANRIVLRLAFISARRKFPNGIIPMTAISSILMLRHLMAEMGRKMASIGPLQQLMNLTVFKFEMKEMPHDDELFREIANFLLELTVLRVNHVPKDSFTVDELLSVMAEIADEIIAEVTQPKHVTSMAKRHALVFSVHELIETYFTGPNEDPRLKVDAYLGLL